MKESNKEIENIEAWLERINKEIISVYHHLDLYKKLSKIIESNDKLKKMDGVLLKWMQNAFTVDLVIGICRIIDTHHKSASLVKFLDKLKKETEYLKRERFLKLYKEDLYFANRDFDNLAGKNEISFPVEKINSDIKCITEEEPFKKIKSFRDQYIAHSDKEREIIHLTYLELFNAFEILERILNKYNVFVRAASFAQIEPILGYWQEVLTIPWIDKETKTVSGNL
ncbi:MAG: hypothetical protein PHU91_02525 [Candidatus Omnitrophica bacterium]|nr:hypothetical protein [Candidatus Omnitrophota bacterium]MDD5236524.1 hypothetical protein [Candidatus Omnitrophota bacterium]MDD5610240.1 hypothetical protein [Candidatus Omnitrophota bacterium]